MPVSRCPLIVCPYASLCSVFLLFLQPKCSPKILPAPKGSIVDNVLETWYGYTRANHEDSLFFFRKDLLKRLHAESGTKHCYMELCLH